MIFKLVILVGIVNLSLCELLAVVNLFRHGSRFPKGKTKFDIRSYNQYDFGKLTPTGMREHVLLGNSLRKKYIDTLNFLPPSFDPTTIYIATSNYDRTYDSAYSQLMGLYPPGTGPDLQSKFQEDNAVPPMNIQRLDEIKQSLGMSALPKRHQVIPIHHESPIDDYSISPLSACHKILEAVISFKNSKEFDDYVSKNYDKTIRKQLCDVFGVGWDNMTFDEAMDIWDWIYIYQTHGWQKDIPSKITQEMITQLQVLYTWDYFILICPNYEIARLYASGLINRILAFFEDVLTHKTSTKMMMFSGHGSTTVGILKALELGPSWVTTEFPPFASNIQIELHRDTSTGIYLVKIYYQGKQVFMKGCKIDCPYDWFKERLLNITIPDQIAACSNSKMYLEGQKLPDLID